MAIVRNLSDFYLDILWCHPLFFQTPLLINQGLFERTLHQVEFSQVSIQLYKILFNLKITDIEIQAIFRQTVISQDPSMSFYSDFILILF